MRSLVSIFHACLERRHWLTRALTEVGKNMDKAFAEVEKELDAKLAAFGWNKSVGSTKSVIEMLQKQGARQVGVPLSDVREASQTREQRI
jgi:hypothetical protein